MKTCYVYDCDKYEVDKIESIVERYIDVKPGDRVFIKPNWVIDPWPGEEQNWVAYTTNGALVEAVLRVGKKQNL